jgi:antitoxin VapB
MEMMTATLFQHGDSQAVQLPRTVQLPGTEVYIKQVGNALVLLPMEHPWDVWWASLTQFSEDFMAERAPLPVQPRDNVFST